MTTDNLLQIIEDSLLLASNLDVAADYQTRGAVIDLAARLYTLTGFDQDAVSGYVWTPDSVTKAFLHVLAVRMRNRPG
jgi:hypothetical protein